MKIIYINLQNNNFLVNTYYQIVNNYNVKTFKHKFLLDALIEKGYEIVNYISCNNSMEDEIERAYFVYKANELEGKIRTITNKNEIYEDDICIVYFHFFGSYLTSKNIKCRKILMGNHFIRVKKGQRFRLYEDGFEVFVNEADVESNEFVNTYFDLKGVKNIILPYVYNDRFKIKKSLENRKNKVLAIGTLSTVEGIEEYSGYKDFYNTNWVQPQGVNFLKYRYFNKLWLDSEVSYIYQGKLRLKDEDIHLLKTLKKIYNSHHEQQGKYMSFDMVDKLNEYKFFVRPEELVGMPSINMIEGMACGCLYFGTMEKVYESLGLIANKHYVKYNGEITDLKKKYKEIKNDMDRINETAICGMNYVRENFNQSKVANDFINELINLNKR